MEWIYKDDCLCVCIKPAGILSTDEPGGMPELVRQALGDPNACVRTVHRLDRVVGGLMVLARSPESAAALSAQIRNQQFDKEYLAVAHGVPAQPTGTFTDLLLRNKSERKTSVVHHLEKGVQEAILDYELLAACDCLSLLRIRLLTGSTHQIRVQFSDRHFPLVGDKKYSTLNDLCDIALWSHRLVFSHPQTGALLDLSAPPPEAFPWSQFSSI